jgi:hypothetical protein
MAEIFECNKIQGVISVFKDISILLIATICFSSMLFIVTTGMMLVFRGG